LYSALACVASQQFSKTQKGAEKWKRGERHLEKRHRDPISTMKYY
jgi:hypothetical protein